MSECQQINMGLIHRHGTYTTKKEFNKIRSLQNTRRR